MKKLLSIILTALMAVNLAACGNAGSSGDEIKLATGFFQHYSDGGLSAFGEYTYKFDKYGNIIKECYYSGGNLYSTIERSFSSYGIQIDESSYTRGDRLENYKEFDEDGNLARETIYSYTGDVDQVNEYNSDGLIVYKESFSYSHYIVRYEYDENGTLVKKYEEDYDDDDNIEFTYVFEYDSDGNYTRRIVTDAEGNTTVDMYNDEVVTDGNKRTILEYGADGEVRYRTEEEYDDKGNLLSKVTYVAYDDDRLLSREELTYDDENRVIGRIYESLDLTEYKYEYADEGYMCKESIIKHDMVYSEGFSDGSDGREAEIINVNYYDADSDKIKFEHFVDGRLTSYAEWTFEYVDPHSVRGRTLDYRDKDRELDPRALIVY